MLINQKKVTINLKQITISKKRILTLNKKEEYKPLPDKFRTNRFKYVIGVFEGGGVKGAAYAGALQACEDGGITLIGACGTSAGSIAAALVAAGASSTQIRKALLTNFSTFVTPNKKIFGIRKFIKRKLQEHDLKSIEKLILKIRLATSMFFREKGISSSEEIQHWLNHKLCEVLEKKPGTTIRFSDLRKPLAILATDISDNQAKIWSTKKTPEDSVAFAVRCSCSIPLFFRPIQNEDSSYVDGGAIANMPLFLTKSLEDIAFTPSLCFQFEKSRGHTKTKELSHTEFIYRIVGTAITSNTDMQLNLNEEWHNVTIDHCGIESTDFFLTDTQKQKLVDSGYEAVRNFVISEKLHPQQNKKNNKRSNDTNRHFHLTETQRLIKEANKEICFIGGDLSWLKDLFISIATAKTQRTISVKILIDKSKFNERDTQKNIHFAKHLGIETQCSKEEIKIRGILIDQHEDYGSAVLIEKSDAPHQQHISKTEHPRLFGHINKLFERNWENNIASEAENIIINQVNDQTIIQGIGNIKQYKDATITIESINTDNLVPLSNNAEIFKLERIKSLEHFTEQTNNNNCFHISGTEWLFIPPVLEETAGKYVVIDGTHRCYLAQKEGKKNIHAIVVRGCESNLPATPRSSWHEIRVNTKKREKSENYFDYSEKDFRHIKAELIKISNKLNTQSNNLYIPPKKPTRLSARAKKKLGENPQNP